MIITRTPFRVSLFGGGTDFPLYFDKYGGAVLGFALNKYCWISLRKLPPFYDYKYRIVYSKDEIAKRAEDIQHPAVKALLMDHEHHNGPNGFEIHYDGEIPARAGLGSSSAFMVGLMRALYTHYSFTTNYKPYEKGGCYHPYELAHSAMYYEQIKIGESVGCQDQVWSAFGGLNKITFSKNEGFGCFHIEQINLSDERKSDFLSHLMLFFTGFQRKASDIESAKLQNFTAKETQLHRLKALVDIAEQVLRDEKRPITDIGLLLDETWQMKKELARDVVSNDTLNEIYDRGIKAGAIGGKLLGAGGGGFFLFVVPPHLQDSVRKDFNSLIEIPVGIDTEGSTVIYNN